MLRMITLKLIGIFLLAISLAGCGTVRSFFEDPTPTPTSTPTPTPTPTPVPRVELGEISDFNVGLNGLSVEGSFKMGDEKVSFSYRPVEVVPEESGLRLNGLLTYDFLGRKSGSLELGAVLTPVDENCEKIRVTTDPLELSNVDLTFPSQTWELDLSLLREKADSVQVEMICQATQMVLEGADSPVTMFLIESLNQFLKQ